MITFKNDDKPTRINERVFTGGTDLGLIYQLDSGEFQAQIQPSTFVTFFGNGKTRKEAILDAISKGKAQVKKDIIRLSKIATELKEVAR